MFQTSTTGLAPGASLLGSALPLLAWLLGGLQLLCFFSTLRTEGRLRKVNGELGLPWAGTVGSGGVQAASPTHWKGRQMSCLLSV